MDEAQGRVLLSTNKKTPKKELKSRGNVQSQIILVFLP
jgi:hypothetical protein